MCGTDGERNSFESTTSSPIDCTATNSDRPVPPLAHDAWLVGAGLGAAIVASLTDLDGLTRPTLERSKRSSWY